MIYYDPTEGATGTLLHPSVLDVAKPLPGLEAATGADFLITPLDDPLPGNVTMPPGSILIEDHLKLGMLVQRKSGGDYLNSIPRLDGILYRMRNVCGLCWLLVTGEFENVGGLTKVNGRITDWGYSSYSGMLDAWQLRGGHIAQKATELEAAEWLLTWGDKIYKLTHDSLIPKPEEPAIGGLHDPYPWRSALMGFPNMGPKHSEKIARHCGTLAASLWWISNPVTQIPGIGKTHIEKWRRWLGLKENEIIMPLAVETLQEDKHCRDYMSKLVGNLPAITKELAA